MRPLLYVSILITIIFIQTNFLYASDEGFFSGRVSKNLSEVSLLRVKIDFANMKYLNKNDLLEVWNLNNPEIKCKGHIIGKSPDYILLKIPEYKRCSSLLNFAPAKYFMFFSKDLVNNIKMGRELISILLKKRLAVKGTMKRSKKLLDSYMDRVEIINKRYKLLRDKLELEWRDELSALEQDNLVAVRNYNDFSRRLNDIEFKLQKYQVQDNNLVNDKWSLDSRLYFKK